MAVLVLSGITAAIVIPLAIVFSIVFVRLFQDRSDSEWLSSIVSVLGISLVLVSLSLVPIDVYLVSSTTDARSGSKYEWANLAYMETMQNSLSIIYYCLFGFMAIFAFVVIPFAYFYYEEWDEGISVRERAYAASKFTIVGLIILVVLLLMGFFVTVGEKPRLDFDWFKDLLKENAGEKIMSFAIAGMAVIGLFIYSTYTAYGLAVWPIGILRGSTVTTSNNSHSRRRPIRRESLPSITSSRGADTNASTQLIRSKYSLRSNSNVNENESRLNSQESIVSTGSRIGAWFRNTRRNLVSAFRKFTRPFSILLGVIYLVISILLALSIFLTAVDKAAYSVCGSSCGFVLAHPEIFNPLNTCFSKLSQTFPVDYVFFCVIIVYLFFATIRGISAVGIRFLWIHLYNVRVGGTAPQGLLVTCIYVMLVLVSLNFTMFYIAPQYVTFGGQTWVNSTNSQDPISCTIEASNAVCFSTVISRVINKITVNRPVFGFITFVLQWVFFALFLISCIVASVKRKLYFSLPSDEDLDAEEDEEDEEGSINWLDRFRQRQRIQGQ